MTEPTTTMTPPNACISCGKVHDATSAAYGDHVPVAGDISVCLYCGHIAAFNADLTLRPLNDAEIRDVAGNREIIALQKVRAKVINERKH